MDIYMTLHEKDEDRANDKWVTLARVASRHCTKSPPPPKKTNQK